MPSMFFSSFFSSPKAMLPILMVLALFFGGSALYLREKVLKPGQTGISSVEQNPSVPESFGAAPTFILTERSGQPLDATTLKGHPWIANFIFTRCAGPCPLMSSKMARLQRETLDIPDLKLLSISVDPLADTPEALRAYAEKYQASPDRWLFLTGGVAELYALIEKGFKLRTGPVPDLTQVGPGDLIVHTTRFVLVDRAGQIRGYFESEEPDFHDKIMGALRSIL